MIRKHGDHFLNKVFTPAEIEYCGKKAKPEIHFGRQVGPPRKRFYKALPRDCQKVSGLEERGDRSG